MSGATVRFGSGGVGCVIVCNSLPKCGSTWSFYCLRDSVLRLGGCDVFDGCEKDGLKVNDWGNPGALKADTIDALLRRGGISVIKSHDMCRDEILPYLEDGRLRVIYIVRHPFDIVASAMDHGERDRRAGDSASNYGKITSVENALLFLDPYWERVRTWWPKADVERARIVRYEDMVRGPTEYIESLLIYLLSDVGWDQIAGAARAAVETYDMWAPENDAVRQQKAHLRFNKGKALRYREYFTATELGVLRDRLGAVCRFLGYEA